MSNRSPALDTILTAIESVTGKRPTRNGKQYKAHCPAHDDRTPSLSVASGRNGKVLLHCFSGCKYARIMDALGLNRAQPASIPSSRAPARPQRTSAPTDSDGRDLPERIFPNPEAAIAELSEKLGRKWRSWGYTDVDDNRIGLIVRWDKPNSKMIRPISLVDQGWIIGGMRAPRPLFRQGALIDAEVVFVAEGEPATDALRGLGLVATTSPHGANSAATADWSVLAGKQCVIVPDNDPAGERYAADVVAELENLTPRPMIRIVRLDDLPVGGDAVEYVEMSRNAGLSAPDIRAKLESLVAETAPLEPEPHPEDLQPSEFPIDALPEPMRTFVSSVADATGTSTSFSALATIVVVAGCVGNRAVVVLKPGWTEPAVLWGALIGRSGSTKSPVLKLVTAALIEIDNAARSRFKEALADYERKCEQYELMLAQWKTSQRGTNAQPTDPPTRPQPPTEPRLVISDITIERLGAMLEANPYGLLVVRDELAGWVGGFDRYVAGRKGSDQPNWLSMHSAGPLTVDRKGANGSYFVERAAVSVLGTIQPGTLRRCFGRAERDSGLLARLLVVRPPDRLALWTDADLPADVKNAWRELLAGLLSTPADTGAAGKPAPRQIALTDEAKTVWVRWHDEHVREMHHTDDDHLTAHYSKLKGICARIALLFSCVQAVAESRTVTQIDADTMRRAIRVTEWLKAEARRVYQELEQTGEQRAQQEFVDWIRRQGGSVTVRTMTHRLSRYRGQAKAAESALDALVDAGVGHWKYPAPGPKGGRPTHVFVLNEDSTITETPNNET